MTSLSGERRTKLLSNKQIATFLKEFKHHDKLQRYTKVYTDLLSGKITRKDLFKSSLEQLLPIFPEKLIPSVWLKPDTFDILKFPKWIPHADPSIRTDSRTLFAALKNDYNLLQYCDRDCFVQHQQKIDEVIQHELKNKTASFLSNERKDIINSRWGFILYYIPENSQTIEMYMTVAKHSTAEEVMKTIPDCLRTHENIMHLTEINPHIVLYSKRTFPIATYMRIPFIDLAVKYPRDKNKITELVLSDSRGYLFDIPNFRETLRLQFKNAHLPVSLLPEKFTSAIFETDINCVVPYPPVSFLPEKFTSAIFEMDINCVVPYPPEERLIPIIVNDRLMALKFDYSALQTALKYVNPEFVTRETSFAIIDRINGFSRNKDERLDNIYRRYPITPTLKDQIVVYNHLTYASELIQCHIFNIIYEFIQCFPREIVKIISEYM